MNDALITQTTVHPGWQERLLMLLGWNFHVYTRTATENVVGASEVEEFRVNLVRPRWMPKHKSQGYGLAEAESLGVTP